MPTPTPFLRMIHDSSRPVTRSHTTYCHPFCPNKFNFGMMGSKKRRMQLISYGTRRSVNHKSWRCYWFRNPTNTMYILNGFVSIFILTYRGVRSIFMRGQHHSVGERSPLLHQHSLTSDFKDYGHSTRALRTCLLHALAYYVLGIVLFSFVVEKWKIVDSLYYATVLVSERTTWQQSFQLGNVFSNSQFSSIFLVYYHWLWRYLSDIRCEPYGDDCLGILWHYYIGTCLFCSCCIQSQ